jgi:HEAT repeat protein
MLNALRIAVGIFVMAIALSISRADASAPSETAEDELLLKEAKVPTDGPGLLEFFRRRVPTEKDQTRITELIRQLGSSDFQNRQKATQELITLGPVALPELRKAQKEKDAEVKRRATECIETIERKASPTVTAAAVRVLKARAPAGATGVLLAFLPHANDDSVEEETTGALLALGVRDGKADLLLAAALDDPMPNRRAMAAMILGRYGTPDQKETVRKLLKDPDPRIRLRAAQGLVAGREKNAIPSLLALLSDGPMDMARQAEDLLTRIAGDQAPKVSLEEHKVARRKCHEAWEGWWKSAEAKLDLAKADVDLVSTNPIQQSRKVAQQFVDAVFKADSAMLRRTAGVPFSLPGMQEFKTLDEMDKFFKELATQRPAGKFSITVQNVVNMEAYAKIAPEHEKPLLERLRHPQFRAVYIQLQIAEVLEEAAVFVRWTGSQARVVGIGSGHPSRKDMQGKQPAAPPRKIDKAPRKDKDKK